MDTLTTNQELVLGGAVLGGIFGTVAIITLAFYILMIVAMWKIFAKAGEAGWKSLIPIYNVYIYFKIAGMKAWFWWVLIVAFVGSFIAGLLGFEQGDMNGVPAEGSTLIGTLVMLATEIFTLVVAIMQCARLSRAFGRGIGTTLGLIFLPNIFQLILAFGSAKYDKKAFKK